MTVLKAYYDLLTRIDHPVFKRDFNEDVTADSPFNSLLNYVFAKQLVHLRDDLTQVQLNKYPDTVNGLGIDRWEETYFGFVKTGKLLETRRTELILKVISRARMSAPAVVRIAQTITGKTPSVIRNLYFSGWTLGSSPLGIDTVLPGLVQAQDAFIYRVSFSEPIDSELLTQLDKELTRIEKGGSTHVIFAPLKLWVLGDSALGIDTRLG